MAHFSHTRAEVKTEIAMNGTSQRALPTGQFQESDNDHWFEFGTRPATDTTWASEFPHVIAVSDGGMTRYARILKTVAYVVVDEDADGTPVTEKWSIKKMRNYI